METYTVCVSNVATSTNITMAEGNCDSIRTYTYGSCDVTEKSKDLTFTATVASDEAYNINFTYVITYYVNYEQDGDPVTISDYATMPAGSLSVIKEVVCDYWMYCPVDSEEGSGANYEPEY